MVSKVIFPKKYGKTYKFLNNKLEDKRNKD